MDNAPPSLTFPLLETLPGFVHRFTLRHPAISVDAERHEVLERLRDWHHTVATDMGFETAQICTAQQVHGSEVVAVDSPLSGPIEGADGIVTATPGLLLGIYVADCCAVYLADPVTGAFGIVHSGKKGSELAIAGCALSRMSKEYGARPEDVLVQLSPCIRPPSYEIDFAAQIVKTCLDAGVRRKHIADCGICTAQDPERFYSYRREKGRTGRMLALMGRRK